MRLKTAETLSGNLSQQTSFNRLYTAFFKKGIRYKRWSLFKSFRNKSWRLILFILIFQGTEVGHAQSGQKQSREFHDLPPTDSRGKF